MMRRINKVAVLGSGLMGAGLACHFANTGLEVLLLDILPPDMSEAQAKNPLLRNSIAQKGLENAIKAKPASLYDLDFARRITVGNLEDDLPKLAGCDWILEAVIERLDIKKQLFEKVERHRKPGTLISSNTSGIPIGMMAEGRSEDFRRHFCGTHFFNPPRYLRLLEVIPTTATDPEVTAFFMDYGSRHLGKQTVLCKDTPAFIANRIGLFALGNALELAPQLGLGIEAVDRLTGPAIGRPKTGTFRLVDLVGLDTAVKVIQDVKANCPSDAAIQQLSLPGYLMHLVEKKFYGNKTGQGFYKKTDQKDEQGKNIIQAFDLATLEYAPSQRVKLPSLDLAKQIDDPRKRIKALFQAEDKGGEFVRRSFLSLFSYASNRIPEISAELFRIDDALRAGFAWDFGPFEYWDIIGVQKGVEGAEAQGDAVAPWVKDMLSKGHRSFYKREKGRLLFYDIPSGSYLPVSSAEGFILLDNYRDQTPVHTTSETTLHDIGDGVLCLEFTSKMNAIGEGILQGIQDAIKIAEEGQWKGLVIGNNAPNFTVGANLMMVAMMAYQQEYDELNMAVNLFQQTVMRCRYSSVPVVAATQGYVFGGGCEMVMHCDAAVCAAESYIGLVEVGSGIIPGGGGTKEFALRLSDSFFDGDVQIPSLVEKFRVIATAQVSTSAYEAFKYGYLQPKKDLVEINTPRNIARAKEKVLELALGYTQPIQREDIQVLGRGGLGALYIAANELYLGRYATEHDIKIAKKVAWVLCGGDLTAPQQVSEQYLLDLEREAFLSLCGEPKSLERMQYILQNGKPLRN
ncbi:MAG: 3-hydroxyacyl-CoA dehydrogenase/enoyl-CoA hydratase family protein [Saprospirales bacterium]|nr:3-hydroxyacyl-CoA dehydrogenase/enoyl-CoA hydratase family protein [Saprospirales bacterium]